LIYNFHKYCLDIKKFLTVKNWYNPVTRITEIYPTLIQNK